MAKYESQFTGQEIDNRLASVTEKHGASYVDPSTNTLLFFASVEAKEQWLQSGDSSLVLDSTVLNFSGTMYQIKVLTDMSKTLNFTNTAEKAEISVSFLSQKKGITDTSWIDIVDDYSVSVYIDKGSTGAYTPYLLDQFVMGGNTFTFDIRKALATGANRVRVVAVGSESADKAQGSEVFFVNLTSMYLAPSNFGWYKPFIEGEPYVLGGLNIGGNLQKILKIKVTKEGYEKTYNINIGSDIYTSTAYVFRDMEFPQAGTGAYNVEMWLDANGLESEHLAYNIICVSQKDKFTAQLVAIGNPAKKVYNFTDNQLFEYCIYNGGAITGTPHIKVAYAVNTNLSTLIDEYLVDVATSSPLAYTASLEVELEDESATMQMEAIMNYGNEQMVVFPVDNSKSYPATTGAVFYLNPSARNNSQSNREKIVNAINSSEIDATFTRMSWVEGADGWTTDENGRKCLLLPAGSPMEMAYQPLAQVSQKTIEFVYKVKNAADYDEPIITICSDVTDPKFRGVKITPKNILVHSRDLNVNDSLQDYNTTDEETLHILVTIIPNYKTNYGNLAQIYCNGNKVRSFSFETADRWDVAANVKMGAASADLYVYKMRVYDRAFESYDALKNYINSLASTAEKEAMKARIEAPLDDSYKLSYDDCVRNGLNTMVIEILDQDQTIPSIVNPSSKQCNLWVNIVNPIEGELDEDFARFFSGMLIENQTIEGQGTTAMTYARWNFRWKLGEAYNKRRITAKKNFASSMHSHKMGATRLFNDLNEKLVGANDANARTAVFQYPVYGFQKILIEGTNGQYRYEPIGLYTIGPDKGDKPTFGFNNKSFKNTLIHMEGTDHTPKGVGMDYPWDKLVYSGGGEGFGAVLQSGDVEVAWEVGAAGDYDPEDDPTDVKAMLDVEFKPAYEVAYNNSPYILGVTENLTQINADVNAWQARKDADGVEYSGLEFFTDGVYDLYYFNQQSQKYEANGVNVLTDLGLSSSDVASMDLVTKTRFFRDVRRQRFSDTWGQYWDTRDAVFTYTAIMLTGATDNFKKNSYPYKFKALADGGKWRWRHDDLDTIFDINNQGLAAKIYSILVGDKTETGSVYRGDNSVFWTLVKETQQEAIKSMVHSIYNAMVELSPYGSSTLDKIYGCYKRYFWDMAQDYFPSSAYNKDAEWTYEDTWAAGLFSSDGINPLTQALGGHYEAERDWVKLRIIFTAAYYNYGPFNPSGYQDISTGQLGYGGANTHTFMFVPAIDFNPTVLRGQSGYFTVGDRVKAGETAPLTIPNISGADTRIYVQGVDWMEDVGDLSDLQVSADYTTLSVGSKRLKRFKIGDEDASKVKTNVKNLDFKDCPSMIVVDARNVSTLGGNVDLTKMPRLQEAYFGGTGVKSISLPNGAKVTKFQIGEEVTQLSMMNLMFLDREGFDYTSLPKLEFLRIENSPAINPYQMLKELYNLEGNALRDIRVIGFNEQGTWKDFEMIANMANDIDKDGNHHIYNGIDSEGVPMDDSKPVIEGKLSTDGNIFEDTRDFIEGAFPNIEMEYNDLYLRIKDPEVYRIIHEYHNVGDDVGMTVKEAESMPAIDNMIFRNSEIVSFDEMDRFKRTQKLEYRHFYEAQKLESINIDNITELSSEAFYNCSSLKKIDGNNVVSANISGFQKCTSLVEANFQKLTDIPAYFFNLCSSLIKVDVSKATRIGEDSFSECKSLSDIIVGDVTEILTYAFYNCTSLKSIDMPLVETIGHSAFNKCTSLAQDINLPNLTSLGYTSFMNTPITGFNAPLLTTIEYDTFSGCASLVTIDLSNIKTIGNGSFYKCSSLVSVDLSSAITIGENAFYNCAELVSVGDLSKVTSLGVGSFNRCAALVSVNLSNKITSLPNEVFIRCSSITSVGDLSNVTSVGKYALAYCQKLASVNLSSATSIGNYALREGRALTSLEFGNLTSLGEGALSFCTNLASVVIRATTPPTLGTNAFQETNNCPIYVPDASVDAYKAATNWSALASRIKPLSEYVEPSNEE